MRRLLCLLVLHAAAISPAGAQERAPDVPFVPTPLPVVERMIELADITASDLVYDLGSGDGRMVILAAARRGARGVGVDVNPVWVREAAQYAERYGVADKVTFRVEDLFKTDLRAATVVMLYLQPHVNRQLEPKLRAELKPGARVVSHEYRIGGWVPGKSEVLLVNGVPHEIHVWTVAP